MSRNRELKPERDDRGRPIPARVSTTIAGENYNYAVRKGLQFGALLDRVLFAMRREEGVLEGPLPQDPFRRWLAERNRKGLTTTPEQVLAKRAELAAAAQAAEENPTL